jgi:hypothetical protein
MNFTVMGFSSQRVCRLAVPALPRADRALEPRLAEAEVLAARGLSGGIRVHATLEFWD